MTWSYLFLSIEQSKEQLHIIDYSISQTTLEQVCFSPHCIIYDNQWSYRAWYIMTFTYLTSDNHFDYIT